MNRISRIAAAVALLVAAVGSAQAQTVPAPHAGMPATQTPTDQMHSTGRTDGTAYGGASTSGTGMTEGERLHADRMAVREMRDRRKPISQGELSVPGQDRGGYIGAGDWNSMNLYRNTMN